MIKKLIISIIYIIFLFIFAVSSLRARENGIRLTSYQKHGIFVPGEILLKFRDGLPEKIKRRMYLQFGLSLIRSFPVSGVQHAWLPPSVPVEEALRCCRQNPDIEFAEPNYIIYACQTFPNDPTFDPQDPDYGVLWGLHNFGQTVGGKSGFPGADISAPDAWEISTGDDDVIIAVIDTGVAYSHPDLAANMWTNPGEDPWIDPNDSTTGNGVDDDGNGGRDDWRGWDFVDGDNDPMDYNGHGTHVAGTIAAVGDNGEGISGVMWKAGIMPLRILDVDGVGTISNAIRAIEYALRKGARIINASWGTPNFSESLLRAIQMCQSNGVLVAAAAGNYASNTDESPFYPASYNLPNIISVAATDQSDNVASFSNWGPSTVDVAAPGVSIYSTWPSWYSIGGHFPDDIESDEDDWATGGTTQWAVVDNAYKSPTHCWTDSPPGNYGNDTDSWLVLPGIDLSGKRMSRLTYHLRMETEAYRDFLYVEASINGITWANIRAPGVGYTGSTGDEFVKIADDISAYDGQPTVYIRFHLVTDSQNTFDGVYIDDVDVISISHTYEGDEFQFLQGTSMATPHISGLAGLLSAAYPTLALNELRWRILNGADELSGLTGKVASGGRINANNSLRLPVAPSGLFLFAVSETEVELNWFDGSVDELGFKVERRAPGEGYVEIARVDPDTTGYTDVGLGGGTSYTYRVRAYNSYGNSGYSNEAGTAHSGGGGIALAGDGGGGGGGGCFVATAAYGSSLADEVWILRQVRDAYLSKNQVGKTIVSLYYRYSPALARRISRNQMARKATRIGLYPVVTLSKWFLNL